jgi:hypothetical protein
MGYLENSLLVSQQELRPVFPGYQSGIDRAVTPGIPLCQRGNIPLFSESTSDLSHF